jgi:hypothetical protein
MNILTIRPLATTMVFINAQRARRRRHELPLPPSDHASNARPRRPAAYWTKVMAGQDFSGLDQIEPVSFNRALWRGLKGRVPYPATRSGADLRADRAKFLAQKTQADETIRIKKRK